MNMSNKVYLYGASGHAKVILDALRFAAVNVPLMIDDNECLNEFEGIPVMHSADGLSPLIVCIGDCKIRRRIVRGLGRRDYLTVAHPSAVIANTVIIGAGSVIMAGAILQASSIVGEHCIINTAASIDHDTIIHDFVHVAPHCTLCGGVEIGEGTWVGAGTTIIQGVHVGKDCYIGAGSVVVKDIPDNSLCYGNPARIIKKLV